MYVVLWWVWGTHVCGVVVGMGDTCVWCCGGYGGACVWCCGGYGGACVWCGGGYGGHVCVVVVDMGDACVCCGGGYGGRMCVFTLHSFLCARI